MLEFDKEQFAALLKKAKGSRSIREFDRQVGVAYTYTSRLLRGKVDTAPSVEVIKKYSQGAANGVTYEDFMIAAGYLPKKTNEEITKVSHVDEIKNIAPPELAQEFKELGFEMISLIKENNITVDELKDLLDIVRRMSSKNKKQGS